MNETLISDWFVPLDIGLFIISFSDFAHTFLIVVPHK